MRGATVGLIAAVLAVAGCKSTDKDDRPLAGLGAKLKGTPVKDKEKGKDKEGKPAGGTGQWWDEGKLPGAGTTVPKASPADSSAKTDAQDALGGRVLDPLGRPARNVFVRIDQVGAAANNPAAVGIYTNNEGFFFTRGLKPGTAYDLTAEATQDGKPITGAVQTKVPNPILLIELRPDLPPPAGGLPAPKGPSSDGFPPAPKPADAAPTAPRPAPKPNDNAWSPGGSVSGVPPATIGGGAAPKPPAGTLPPPDDVSIPPKPSKPENVADGPKDPFKPPALNVPGGPGPAVPPLPTLPPSFNQPGGRSSMNGGLTTGANAGKVALLDSLERPWELASAPANSLVLVSFVTSTCEHSRAAAPVLRDVQSRYGASGLQVAAVLCDDLPQKDRAALASKYGRDMNLNYAVYVEPGAAGGVRDRFGVEQYPTAFLLTPGGKVLWSGHPGDRAALEAAIKQSSGK